MTHRPDTRYVQTLTRLTVTAALFLAGIAIFSLGMVWLLLVLG